MLGRAMLLAGDIRGSKTLLALCETEPEVQAYWLRCIREMLDAGVDGVDFREENHSTHTDYPRDYGYNPAVLAQCASRGTDDIAQVRGDAYTAFLRRAKALIGGAGRPMRYNLQIDWFRPDPSEGRAAAYPANLDFQWRRWIDEGLMDEAILRFYYIPFDCLYEDDVAREMIERCQARELPMTVNRYLNAHGRGGAPQDALADEFRRIRDDDRFGGFILYETNSFMKPMPGGGYEITRPVVRTFQ